MRQCARFTQKKLPPSPCNLQRNCLLYKWYYQRKTPLAQAPAGEAALLHDRRRTRHGGFEHGCGGLRCFCPRACCAGLFGCAPRGKVRPSQRPGKITKVTAKSRDFFVFFGMKTQRRIQAVLNLPKRMILPAGRSMTAISDGALLTQKYLFQNERF